MKKDAVSVNQKRMNLEMSWKEIGFTLEKTQDQSWTLRQTETSRPEYDSGQSMHHTGGAWSETVYLYQPVLAQMKKWQLKNPALLSVGLGLGYVELLVARELLPQDYSLLSYETVPELRDYFLTWLKGEPLPQEVEFTYNEVGQRVADQDLELLGNIKGSLLKAWERGQWKIEKALEDYTPTAQKYDGFMYDAFSQAVSPQLWEEEFIFRFLKDMAQTRACLSTYSCNGPLKRALKRNQFDMEIRAGFLGKRNCTWAVRESISDVP
jgi:hypothetical protein